MMNHRGSAECAEQVSRRASWDGASGSPCRISGWARSRPRSTPVPAPRRCMPTKSMSLRSAACAWCVSHSIPISAAAMSRLHAWRLSRTAGGERHHRAGGRDPPRHRKLPRQSRHHGLSQAAGAQRAAGPLSGRRGRFLYESRPAAGAAPAACASCGFVAVKIAILSRKSDLYSTRRLVEAGNQRGHDMRVIDPLRCYMNIATDRPMIHYHGEALTGFDAVIPRIGASVTFFGTAVLRQFEMLGVFPLNESVAITRARDKLRSLQLLSRKGIGLPITGFVHSPDDTGDALRM